MSMNFPPPSEKQARIIWFAITMFAVTVNLAIIGGAIWGLGLLIRLLSPVLWPIAVAGVVAYLLDPVIDWLTSKGISRLRALILVFASAFVLVVSLLGTIIPGAIHEAGDLVQTAPKYTKLLQHRIERWVNHPPASLSHLIPENWHRKLGLPPAHTNSPVEVLMTNDVELFEAVSPSTNSAPAVISSDATTPFWAKAFDPKTLKSAGGWVAAMLPEIGKWLFSQAGKLASWFGVLSGLALIPVYTFYFLLEKRGITAQWTDYLPVSDSRFKDELVFVLRNINDYLVVFFRGQVVVALCDGMLYGIGFLIINLPYALLLGLVSAILSMVPFLGSMITCAAALLIAFAQFGDWTHFCLVLGVFGFVQIIEGFILQPRIIGDRVGLHPVTIIIALMVGTTVLGGVLGGILAIPLTAALRVLMFHYVWTRRDPETGTR